MKVLAAVAEELGALSGVPVGIGPMLSSAGAMRALLEEPPESVVLIGTCGAYPGRGKIGEVIIAEQVGFSSGTAVLGLGYVPRPPSPLPCTYDRLPQIDARPARVLTCPAVSTDPHLVDRIGDGWDVEHLESYGVVWACKQLGIRCSVVLGIANIVGPDAHVEWLTNREMAQEAARKAIMPWLE